jgi:SAM-dependent methyltransferase
VISTAIVEGAAYVGRLATRRGMHQRARDLADVLDRPLIVVGARSGGGGGLRTTGNLSQYSCGDVCGCVDLAGCTDCKSVGRDVCVYGSIPVEDDSSVVFVSHVLEYVDDPDRAWAEITRVAGSPERVYVSRNQPWATWTRVATGARWMIDNAPPSGEFKYHAVTRAPIDVDALLAVRRIA